MPPESIPEELVRQLMDSGAICTCGGLHVVSVDELILLRASPAGRSIPLCSCSGCPTCGSWRDHAAEKARTLMNRAPASPLDRP